MKRDYKKNSSKQSSEKFYKHNYLRHPTYVYEKNKNNWSFLDITHNPPKTGDTYVKLNKNPEPGKKEDAYINTKTSINNKGRFKKNPLLGWGFSKKDKKTVKGIIDKNKKGK